MKRTLTAALRTAAARVELSLAPWGQPVALVDVIEVRAAPEQAALILEALELLKEYSVCAASRVRRRTRRIVSVEVSSSFRSEIQTAFIDLSQHRSPEFPALLLFYFASAEEVRRRLDCEPVTDEDRVRLSNANLRTTSRFMRWLAIEQDWPPAARDEIFGWLYDELQPVTPPQQRRRAWEEFKDTFRKSAGKPPRSGSDG